MIALLEVPRLLADVVLGLTALALGVLARLAIYDLEEGITRPTSLFYAAARIGLALIVGLIGWVVLESRVVPLTIQSVLYIVGLVLVDVGYIGLLMIHIRGRRKPTPFHGS